MPIIIVAIASLLGLGIFAFSDAGEKIAAPVKETKEIIQESSKFALIAIGGLLLWSFLRS